MPNRDIAEELREVLRLHALHMKSIMDRSAPAPAPYAPATPAFVQAKPVAKFAKLMRAAM
jgi:hypothetical protein